MKTKTPEISLVIGRKYPLIGGGKVTLLDLEEGPLGLYKRCLVAYTGLPAFWTSSDCLEYRRPVLTDKQLLGLAPFCPWANEFGRSYKID